MKYVDLTIGDLMQLVMRGRWLLVSFTAAFMLHGLYSAFSTPVLYRSSATLFVYNYGSAGRGGVQSYGFGIRSIGSPGGQHQFISHVLRSRAFSLDFITAHDLEKSLFFSGQRVESVVRRNGLLESSQVGLRTVSDHELFQEFQKRLVVDSDYVAGLLRISVDFESPTVARDVLDLLIAHVQEYVERLVDEEMVLRTQRLELRFSEATDVDVRARLGQELQQQNLISSLTPLNRHFPFVILEPPDKPIARASPKRTFLVVRGAVIGFSLSVLVLLCWQGLKFTNQHYR